MGEPLAILERRADEGRRARFVERVSADGVPPEERVAVFDNDGTLWCEKPLPIQADFILRRLHEMAEADPALRERQPWKAALRAGLRLAGDGDGGALRRRRHERADAPRRRARRARGNQRRRLRGAGGRVPALGAASDARPRLLECAYAPMVELLRYLEANGFSNYIASGGGRDFMRPISDELYGIPRDRVIGSSTALEYVDEGIGGSIMRKAEADYLDDGPQKPVRIWSRIGRRPILAAGNSNGDIQMLDFTQHADRPSLRLLVLHDDAEREFDYTAGAEEALERARAESWTVVSVANDWATVFPRRE